MNVRDDLLDRLESSFSDLAVIPPDCIITGGPVRDVLMHRVPADLDLACPDASRAAAAFARAVSGRRVTLGTRFQTERVVVGSAIYDFTPMLGGSIREDLQRRDFTINAIALTLDGGIIDPFNGIGDIERGTVRMVDVDNLRADPLRILRAVRFAANYGMEVDEATLDACRELRSELRAVAGERMTHELRQILAADHPAAELLGDIALDRKVFGRALERAEIEVWENLTASLSRDQRPVALLALLLRDAHDPANTPPLVEPGWTRDEVASTRQAIAILRAASAEDSPLVTAARNGREATSIAAAVLAALGRDRDAAELDHILHRDPSPFEIRTLLDGSEIARLTGATGPAIGRLKDALWQAQLEGRVRTAEEAREYLLARASDPAGA